MRWLYWLPVRSMNEACLHKPPDPNANSVVAWRVLFDGRYIIFQQKPTWWYEKYPEQVEELIVNKGVTAST